MNDTSLQPTTAPDTSPRRGVGLSAKLLLLTAGFVMLSEVMVFVPSVANFRVDWLKERLAAAKTAAIAADVAPGHQIPDQIREDLLMSARVHAVAVQRDNFRRLVVQADMPPDIAAYYNLQTATVPELITDALAVYLQPADRFIRVAGRTKFGPNMVVEIVVSQAPLKEAMISFGLNILALSVVISLITATLVYLTLTAMLVRPIRHLTRNMVAFSDDPENAHRIISPSARRDEIGTAERELAHMQTQINDMLQQKSRLAALGMAVSKVNHDLRNMLSSAQLISDRLGRVKDPTVQRFAPKLIASLDRAIRLCTETLRYGRARETPPERAPVDLKTLVDETGESLGLPRPGIDWRVDVAGGLAVDADRDQLFRVFSNLGRNAVQALESGGAQGGAIAVSAHGENGTVVVTFADTGPGIGGNARENLFKAFQTSARKGGTGLGLAIAHELIEAHGGEIALVDGDGPGATFRFTLPQAGNGVAVERPRRRSIA